MNGYKHTETDREKERQTFCFNGIQDKQTDREMSTESNCRKYSASLEKMRDRNTQCKQTNTSKTYEAIHIAKILP